MIFAADPGPMHLPGVERETGGDGAYGELIRNVRASGGAISQIWHLFAFNPAASRHLERFTHEIMRGPGPLSPGMRELIAAFVSKRNHCPF